MHEGFKKILFAMLVAGSLAAEHQAYSAVETVQSIDSLQALKSLQEECWSFIVAESPELATFVGAKGAVNSRWSDFTLAGIENRQKMFAGFYSRLKKIDRSSLSKVMQLQYDILEWLTGMEVEAAQYPFHYLAIDQMEGVHLLIPIILQIVPQEGPQGYEDILARMQGVPALLEQHIDLLKEGMKSGIVASQVIMDLVPGQIIEQLTEDPENSAFFQAFLNVEDENLRQRARDSITNIIYPAYRKFYAFVINEYMPACRETTGFCDLPNGRLAYALLVKEHTTTNLTPEEIHQIGLDEVARIHAEMVKVMLSTGFVGTISEFSNFLKEEDEFFYATKEDLLQGYRDLLSRIEGQLPNLFNIMPTLPCQIEAVPEYSEASTIMAYYYPGSVETGRPGKFFVNTYSLKDHPKWQMEALTLHEALPGHHFQISVSQLADVPDIQKYSFTTAFIEGWGLYSESLGKELGLYQDPFSYYGRLSCEMMRAVRLVVDTGLHEFGWSRQKAIDYFRYYLPLDDHEIINEIDRYIVMPGQALAYKIGELKIKSWRRQAEQKPGFNIRDFHDNLLQLGSCLPLEAVDRYLE